MVRLASLGPDVVSPSDVEKLKLCGIHSVKQLLVCDLPYVSNRTGLDVKALDELGRKTATAALPRSCIGFTALELVDHGLPVHCLSQAGAKPQSEVACCRIIDTGCEALNALLDKGLWCGAVTEFAGGTATGKTQCAVSICANLLSTTALSVAYIDTSASFDPFRISEMLRLRGMDAGGSTRTALQNRVQVFPCRMIHECQDVLDHITSCLGTYRFVPQNEPEGSATPTSKFYRSLKLVVVDSVGCLVSPLLCSKVQNRFHMLNQFVRSLKFVAQQYGVAVLVLNHMVSAGNTAPASANSDANFGTASLKPALGAAWTFVPEKRIGFYVSFNSGKETSVHMVTNERPQKEREADSISLLDPYDETFLDSDSIVDQGGAEESEPDDDGEDVSQFDDWQPQPRQNILQASLKSVSRRFVVLKSPSLPVGTESAFQITSWGVQNAS
eukprot:ANDGO_02438.mRNA.1 putative DNA repair protein RAD51 homolog 4